MTDDSPAYTSKELSRHAQNFFSSYSKQAAFLSRFEPQLPTTSCTVGLYQSPLTTIPKPRNFQDLATRLNPDLTWPAGAVLT